MSATILEQTAERRAKAFLAVLHEVTRYRDNKTFGLDDGQRLESAAIELAAAIRADESVKAVQ